MAASNICNLKKKYKTMKRIVKNGKNRMIKWKISFLSAQKLNILIVNKKFFSYFYSNFQRTNFIFKCNHILKRWDFLNLNSLGMNDWSILLFDRFLNRKKLHLIIIKSNLLNQDFKVEFIILNGYSKIQVTFQN